MIWFTMLYKVVPTFQSADKIHDMVYYALQSGSNFSVCGESRCYGSQCFTKWFQLFSLWMKSKSAEQYFPVGTFILLSVLGGLASESADEILG